MLAPSCPVGHHARVEAADLLELARNAERRGEVLLAVDLADRGLAERPDDLELQRIAVLALARAGATDAAAKRFTESGLARSEDREVLALGARIAKDLALRAEGESRIKRAQRAAHRYAALGGSYPLVNAATLSVIAGDQERAREHASGALAALKQEPPSAWTGVTASEALLVLGRFDEAAAALNHGAADGLEQAAAASAYRQLALLCRACGADPAMLAPLRGPGVLHFCGHQIGRRFLAEDERRVGTAIRAELDRDPVASAYGSLAAGGDILVAEALLDRKVELHIVLPCSREAFLAYSVRPVGEQWIERFDRCVRAADTVTVVTPSARHVDDGLFAFTSEMAMGMALLRARWLHADVRQLAIWDGEETASGAGTAVDVAAWRRRGGRTVVLNPSASAEPVDSPPDHAWPRRQALAFLFADVAGYASVHDEALPRFSEVVMDELAEVLAQHAPGIVTHNTWGDAVSVVTYTAEQAARLALDMQDAMAALDPVEAGLPSKIAFRLGAHVGPVFIARNAVRGQADVVGEHINRTARLEPVTPPGEVYVTDSFAAALELAGIEDFRCDYVGHLPGAKNVGLMRMHRLRRRVG